VQNPGERPLFARRPHEEPSMARCRNCEKGGLFQRVNKEGLCIRCEPVVTPDIETHANVIYEAMHVYERATDPAERLAHCDRVIEAASALLPYEAKGLQTCSPPARLLADEYRGFREQCTRA
jgi:hypothetical protein